MHLLFVLLGCNIGSILLNRIETAFKCIDENIYPNNTSNLPIQITWFLSGGIKYDFIGAKSEASIMEYNIKNMIDLNYNKNNLNIYEWNFVLDEKSTNTAENLIHVSKFVNSSNYVYDDIYIITSDFHNKRTKLMLDMIDISKNFKWILGNLEEPDSRYWENIHINNVANDVSQAIMKFL